MIRFIAGSDGKKNIIGLGLSHENLRLLKEGKPMSFPASEILYGKIKQITPDDTFFIFSDLDEATMLDKLSEKFDTNKTLFKDFRTNHSGEKH